MASSTVSSPPMANSPSYAHYAAIRNTHYAAASRNPISASAGREIQEIAEKFQQMQLQLNLNIEVVDDTALIYAPIISNNKRRREIKNGKKKRPRGKARRNSKLDDRISGDKKKAAAAAAYSRAEMLALSFEGVEDKKKWTAVYGALDAAVAAEYDGLVSSAAGFYNHHFHRRPFLENYTL